MLVAMVVVEVVAVVVVFVAMAVAVLAAVVLLEAVAVVIGGSGDRRTSSHLITSPHLTRSYPSIPLPHLSCLTSPHLT
jgi:hypothetical protein